jgi:hypothetical protein
MKKIILLFIIITFVSLSAIDYGDSDGAVSLYNYFLNFIEEDSLSVKNYGETDGELAFYNEFLSFLTWTDTATVSISGDTLTVSTVLTDFISANDSTSIDVLSDMDFDRIYFIEDSGINVLSNISVTSDVADGTLQGYTAQVDSLDVMGIYGLSDGSGGVDNEYLKCFGGIVHNVTTVADSVYTTEISDTFIHVTYTATGAVTVTLSTECANVEGLPLHIKDAGGNAGTNNITIDTEGSETIDGSATVTISSNDDSVSLYSDGSNWFIY